MVENKIRIGVISPFYPPFLGGAEIVAERVTNTLLARGYAVEVQTLKHDDSLPGSETLGDLSITRHPFSYRKVLGFTDISSPSFVETVRHWDVDVVHMHSVTFPTLLSRALDGLKKRGTPIMVMPHGVFEAVSGSYKSLRALTYRFLARAVLKNLFRNVSLLGASSEFDVELLASNKIYNGRFRVLLNGVDVPELHDRSILNDEESGQGQPLNLLHVASVKPNKGHLDVLQALETLGSLYRYHVVGSGGEIWKDHEKKVKDYARSSKKAEVVFHGRVDNSERDELYRRADVVIIPSHMETFPLSVLEGMSYGKAVIATDVGGVVDMVEHETNGLLIPARESSAVASALQELTDPALRARIGREARKKIVQTFTWESVVDRYEAATLELRRDG